MNFFATPRGCVVKLATHSGGASSFKLDGLSSGSVEAPIIIRNCNISDQDIVLPVSTLSSQKILYTFGQDFGQVQIMGTVFLGPAGKSQEGLQPLIQFFNANRINTSQSPVTFSLPGNIGYQIAITSLVISQAEPELNSHDFTIGGIIVSSTS